MSRTFKFILSDLDGVIRRFPPERDRGIESRFRIPEGTLGRTAFEPRLLESVIRGHINDAQWRAAVVARIAEGVDAGVAELAVREWSEFPGALDPGYLELLSQRFPSVPVCILTNATSRLDADLKSLGIGNRFPRVFNSSQIAFIKPEPEIFRHVLGELECEPSEVLFIDDSQSHIEAASSLGFAAYHYVSLNKFRDDWSREESL